MRIRKPDLWKLCSVKGTDSKGRIWKEGNGTPAIAKTKSNIRSRAIVASIRMVLWPSWRKER